MAIRFSISNTGEYSIPRKTAATRSWRRFQRTAHSFSTKANGSRRTAFSSDKAEMKLKVTAPAGWSSWPTFRERADGFASSQPAFWGMVAAGKYTPVDVKAEKSEVTVQTLKAPAEVATPMAEAVGQDDRFLHRDVRTTAFFEAETLLKFRARTGLRNGRSEHCCCLRIS